MTKVCEKHAAKPVKIYHQCIGCEVENLRQQVKELQEIIRFFKAQPTETPSEAASE